MLIRLLLALFVLAAPARADEPLVVFAASSLAGPLDAVAEAWDGEVVISYAGSALLARQIVSGARADVVILANTAWMDHLVTAQAVDADAVLPFLSNQLALVRTRGRTWPRGLSFAEDLENLPEDVRVATGFVEAVPLGIYARQALESLGQFEALQPRLVQVENARLALALVGRGDVEAAIVYQSDARADPRVESIVSVSPALHDPILYVAAPLMRGTDTASADFLAHLGSADSLEVFGRAQFRVLSE